MSPCCAGHEDSVPVALWMSPSVWAEWFMSDQTDPHPMTLLATFEVGVWRFLGFVRPGRSCYGQSLCWHQVFCFQAFSSLPWSTLKATIKTSDWSQGSFLYMFKFDPNSRESLREEVGHKKLSSIWGGFRVLISILYQRGVGCPTVTSMGSGKHFH